MRKLLFILTALYLCVLLVNVQSFAEDSPEVCKKLVAKVKGEHNHPDYYTGKYGFMLSEDKPCDGGKLEKGLYLMSWLVLDPPYFGASATSRFNEDIMKELFGVSEKDVGTDPKAWPVAGQKSLKGADGPGGLGKDGSWWVPINFEDLAETFSKPDMFTTGRELDWDAEWGQRDSVNNFIEYLFSLVKWDKGGTVTFKVGSDDNHITWVNGEFLCENPNASQNWVKDMNPGEAEVPAGEWVTILAKLGENGGECGYTMRVEPPPDDHTLDTETAKAVSLKNKLTATWGYIKAR